MVSIQVVFTLCRFFNGRTCNFRFELAMEGLNLFATRRRSVEKNNEEQWKSAVVGNPILLQFNLRFLMALTDSWMRWGLSVKCQGEASLLSRVLDRF